MAATGPALTANAWTVPALGPFRLGAKLWHLDLGWVQFERPLSGGCAYVHGRKSKWERVREADLRLAPPPKPTREQCYQRRYRSKLASIERSGASYYVAGSILAGHSVFCVSFPPDQRAAVVGELEDVYGVDYDDSVLSPGGTDRTSGWSNSVVVDFVPQAVRARLEAEAGVRSTDYHDTGRVSIQSREYVLGFLGSTLKIKLSNAGPRDPAAARARVPDEFKADFDAGLAPTFVPDAVI